MFVSVMFMKLKKINESEESGPDITDVSELLKLIENMIVIDNCDGFEECNVENIYGK